MLDDVCASGGPAPESRSRDLGSRRSRNLALDCLDTKASWGGTFTATPDRAAEPPAFLRSWSNTPCASPCPISTPTPSCCETTLALAASSAAPWEVATPPTTGRPAAGCGDRKLEMPVPAEIWDMEKLATPRARVAASDCSHRPAQRGSACSAGREACHRPKAVAGRPSLSPPLLTAAVAGTLWQCKLCDLVTRLSAVSQQHSRASTASKLRTHVRVTSTRLLPHACMCGRYNMHEW